MTDTPTPLEEPAVEPSLDVLWGEQLEISDEALNFFIRKERAAMKAYFERVEGRQK
jgi:hypothetical protein